MQYCYSSPSDCALQRTGVRTTQNKESCDICIPAIREVTEFALQQKWNVKSSQSHGYKNMLPMMRRALVAGRGRIIASTQCKGSHHNDLIEDTEHMCNHDAARPEFGRARTMRRTASNRSLGVGKESTMHTWSAVENQHLFNPKP